VTLHALGRAAALAAALALALALALAACAQPPAPSVPPDTRVADDAALRALIQDWSAAAQAKDAARFVSVYADDAVVMMAGAPDIRGIAAIREAVPAMMQDPAFALSFEADRVEVARSGDLAYETGSYSMTMTGSGQEARDRDGPLRGRLAKGPGRRLEGRRRRRRSPTPLLPPKPGDAGGRDDRHREPNVTAAGGPRSVPPRPRARSRREASALVPVLACLLLGLAVMPARPDPRERGAVPGGDVGAPRGAAGGDAERVSADVEVRRLADGVWLHRSFDDVPGYGRVGANGLVVASGGEAALVDTPWTDAQTRDLAAWVRDRLSARLTTVVPTHSHADCMGGLGAAHALGARSYALAATVAFAKRDGLPVPGTAFEREVVLRVGTRSLEVRFVGPSHTADAVVVWLPEVEILFGGDLLRSLDARSLGYTREADLEAWPESLAVLERTYPRARLLVPGHGEPGGLALLHHTRALLSAPAAARP
jgi:metallo-beta-lactamase class B